MPSEMKARTSNVRRINAECGQKFPIPVFDGKEPDRYRSSKAGTSLQVHQQFDGRRIFSEQGAQATLIVEIKVVLAAKIPHRPDLAQGFLFEGFWIDIERHDCLLPDPRTGEWTKGSRSQELNRILPSGQAPATSALTGKPLFMRLF